MLFELLIVRGKSLWNGTVSKSQISIRHICLILKLALYKCHIIIIIIITVHIADRKECCYDIIISLTNRLAVILPGIVIANDFHIAWYEVPKTICKYQNMLYVIGKAFQ